MASEPEPKMCPMLAMGVMTRSIPLDADNLDGANHFEPHCRRAKCAWWINYGQDDGGCAIVWAGECIELHVQKFCFALEAIAENIAALDKTVTKLVKPLKQEKPDGK